MRIVNNIMALNTWRTLGETNRSLAKTLERLSSGLRINRAADDAAGLAISEKMRAQVRGLKMAAKNAQDGISLIQTAEGALNEVHAILQRMRELAVQAANDTNMDQDRAHLQAEVDQLLAEIDRIANTTEFNKQPLFSGTGFSGVLHVGANQGQNITVTISPMDTTSLGINGLLISTQSDADAAIDAIDNALEQVSTQRSNLGAYQNRLEHTINNLNVAAENLSAAESRIRDADMAQEMMNFVRQQILLQSGTAMLAQANVVPQTVLQLLA